MVLKPKENLLLLTISIIVLLYLIFFLVPYAEKHGFLNESLIPQQNEKLIYNHLSIPILSLYSIYTLKTLKKITFLKSLIYPLLIVIGYLGLFMCLISEGGAVLWLMVITIIIPIVLIPISLVIGIRKDINYFRKNRIIK